jgi:tetratricopeptide (TPR) repeat protein
MKRALAWSWTGLLVMLGGCVHTREPADTAASVQKRLVKCAGDCVELHRGGNPDQHALLRKVEELLKERRRASLDGLVARHAETVLEILRKRDPKQAATEAELTIAAGIDALLQHPQGDGWHDRLRGRGRGGIENAEETLQHARDFARHQQWSSVVPLIQRYHDAAAAKRGRELATGSFADLWTLSKSPTGPPPYPYHAIRMNLFLAEAQRHLKQTQAAAQTWQHAATEAAFLSRRVQVPNLLEQIAGDRPVPTVWPAEVANALSANLPACLRDLTKDANFTPEAFVWLTIGKARLARAEVPEALTAFKRADSHGAFPVWDDFLALHQAKALLALQQTPAATSVLTPLVGKEPASPWRAPALALLGAGKLQDGHTQQALAFLCEAVKPANADYTWRADAEANLGLVYLITGNETEGLHALHDAQAHFLATRDIGGAVQCLENEAAYLQQTGKADTERQVRLHIQECESSVP